eukprot:5925909-Ditylum_brightwellii.AAC.1
MATLAETLIGSNCITTARTTEEINAIEELVKKGDWIPLDAKDRKTLHDAAEQVLLDTFDLLRTKPGTAELENVYNIALQLKDLKHKIQIYDMADVFGILTFDETTGVPTNANAIDLFDHYKMVTSKQVKQCCQYLNKFASEYIIQNL